MLIGDKSSELLWTVADVVRHSPAAYYALCARAVRDN